MQWLRSQRTFTFESRIKQLSMKSTYSILMLNVHNVWMKIESHIYYIEQFQRDVLGTDRSWFFYAHVAILNDTFALTIIVKRKELHRVCTNWKNSFQIRMQKHVSRVTPDGKQTREVKKKDGLKCQVREVNEPNSTEDHTEHSGNKSHRKLNNSPTGARTSRGPDKWHSECIHPIASPFARRSMHKRAPTLKVDFVGASGAQGGTPIQGRRWYRSRFNNGTCHWQSTGKMNESSTA